MCKYNYETMGGFSTLTLLDFMRHQGCCSNPAAYHLISLVSTSVFKVSLNSKRVQIPPSIAKCLFVSLEPRLINYLNFFTLNTLIFKRIFDLYLELVTPRCIIERRLTRLTMMMAHRKRESY